MRVIVRTVSELCVTVGTLIVLFVVHALFWTGVQADQRYESGAPFAIMYIPRLGFTWNKPVLEGTGTLKKGLGHYARTARLGQTGDFAVAGRPADVRRPLQGLPPAPAG